MVTQTTTPERLIQNEIGVVNTLNAAGKIAEIPVAKDYLTYKQRLSKSFVDLQKGISPQTGRPITPEKKYNALAQLEVDALKHSIAFPSDAILAASKAKPSKITSSLNALTIRGREAALLDNAPNFLETVAAKIDEETTKNALLNSANTLRPLSQNPESRRVMLESLKNWEFWQRFEKETQELPFREKVIRETEEKIKTIDNLIPPAPNIIVTLKPSLDVSVPKNRRRVDKALKRSQSFRDLINAGHFTLDEQTKQELSVISIKTPIGQGRFPIQEFQGSEFSTAIALYAKGAKSEKLEKSTDAAVGLSEADKKYLYRVAFVVKALEETYSADSRDIFVSQEEPEIIIQSSPVALMAPTPNQVVIQRDGFGFLRPVLEKGVDFAKEKAQKLVVNALKKTGKKLIEEGIKKGAGIAIKAGITKAAEAGVAALAGLPTGGVGTLVVLTLDVLLKLAKKALSWISRKIKSHLKFLTGEEDTKKALFWLTLAGGVVFLALRIVPLAALMFLAAAGIFAVSTTIIATITTAILIVIISIPILTALILFIINSSAFVVPQGGYLSDVPFPDGSSPFCSDQKIPVAFPNNSSSSIAKRAWEITADLYQGFWCFWNRSPDDFPTDVVLYPPSYPELFNETLFAQNPNPPVSAVSNDASNLFWCTQLVVKAYQETGNEIQVVYRSDWMKNWFITRNKFVPSYSATPTNIPQGSVIFFRVSSGPPRTNHVAIVHHFTGSDSIEFVQSNAPTKEGSLTFEDDGQGVIDLPGIDVEGFGIP